MQDRSDVVLARDVRGSEDREHARRLAHPRKIHRADPRVGASGEPERGVQRSPRLEDIVGIGRLARDVEMRAVVPHRRTGRATGRGLFSRRSRVVHAVNPVRSYSLLGFAASAPELSR